MKAAMNGETASRVFQRVAHASTPPHVGELNFRVRDGYGCYLTTLAVSRRVAESNHDHTKLGQVHDRNVSVVQFAPGPVDTGTVQSDHRMSDGFGLLVLADSTPRCLGAYIPSLSNSSSTSDLKRYFVSE